MHSPSSVTADISGTQTCTQVLWGCAVQFLNHRADFPFSPAFLPALLLFPSMEKSPLLPPRLGTHQYCLVSNIMLFSLFRSPSYAPCECWARTAEEKWRLSTAYIGWFFFPCTLLWLPLTRLLSAFGSDPVLLSLDWRKDDPESLYFWVLSPLLWILKIIKL